MTEIRNVIRLSAGGKHIEITSCMGLLIVEFDTTSQSDSGASSGQFLWP